MPRSPARHSCLDPGFERFDELLVRERGRRAPRAWIPGPENERIHLHVLDDLLCRAAAAVTGWILHLFADLLLAPTLPEHGQGSELPGRDARHEAAGRVRRLMASLAPLRGRAVAILSAVDERLMNGAGIALPGRSVLMAVEASRVHEDARDRIERRGRSRGLRLDLRGGHGEPTNGESRENRHRPLLKPSGVDLRAAASGCACRSR